MFAGRVPDDFVVDSVIPVNDAISHADHISRIGYSIDDIWIMLICPAQRFTDDLNQTLSAPLNLIGKFIYSQRDPEDVQLCLLAGAGSVKQRLFASWMQR